MKRNDVEPISKLIQRCSHQEGLESPLNEQRLLDFREAVLGPTITSYTRDLCIHNQVLHVYLVSAALRQELVIGKKLLVYNLNQKVGTTAITNIIFR